MTNLEWEFEDWDGEEEQDEQETSLQKVRSYLRNIVIVIVLGGLLFLSGIYQGTLFHRTPDGVQEDIPAFSKYSEITVPLRVVVFLSTGSKGSSRTEENVRTLVQNADALWNQGSVTLEVDELVFATVTDVDVSSFIEYPSELFDHFTDTEYDGVYVFLLETLNGINGIAFTSSRTVAIADFTTVRDYRTLAHEIGHIFRLSHTANRSDLMFSGSNGITLSGEEIEKARRVALEFGKR